MRRSPMLWLLLAGTAVIASHAGASNVGALRKEGAEVRWRSETELVADAHDVIVALPRDTWKRPGGVQFAIQWASEEDDLDLRVTGPDGRTTYSSEGIFSTAEAVIVPDAGNGRYRVEVLASTSGVRYLGLAEVERPPRAQPARDLLPDLAAVPARNLTFALGSYYSASPRVDLASCYPEEQLEDGAELCLRFDQIVENRGEGPFELRYALPPGDPQPSGDDNLVTFGQMKQRLYRSDGSAPRERTIARYEFHPAHAHFHYREFAESRLRPADAHGRKGAAVVSNKNGFCMVDVALVKFGAPDAARRYIPPSCLLPSDGTDVINGISRGWADVYNWFLPDQYIEVSEQKDGVYVLETIVDPASTVKERNKSNNCAAVLIKLSGMQSASPSARVLRPLAAC